eukprot:m.661611 g.661611  ORF g.661611 m.661611 type:complete len:399 (+) comp58466_c0_seq5:344-1540(+)
MTSGAITGLQVTHRDLLTLARVQQDWLSLGETSVLACSAMPSAGLALLNWIILPALVGCSSVLLPVEIAVYNAPVWLKALQSSQAQVLVSSVLPLLACINVVSSKELKTVSLERLKKIVVICKTRPAHAITNTFSALFNEHKFNGRMLYALESRIHSLVGMQALDSAPSLMYLDRNEMRAGRIRFVERGSPKGVLVSEVGGLANGVCVLIAEPDTLQPCSSASLGEVLVMSTFSRKSYAYSDQALNDRLTSTHLQVVVDAAKGEVYGRTGLIGFVEQGRLYVVGPLEEALIISGFRHFATDIEQTVERCHGKIASCAALLSDGSLTLVVESDCLSEMPSFVPTIVCHVLEAHQASTHALFFVGRGGIPLDCNGDKQRFLLRAGLAAGSLAPHSVFAVA